MPEVQRKVRSYLDDGKRGIPLRRVPVDEAESLIEKGLAVGVRGHNGRLQYIQFAPDPNLLPKLRWPLRNKQTEMETLECGRRVIRHRVTPPEEGLREVYCAAVFAVLESVTNHQAMEPATGSGGHFSCLTLERIARLSLKLP